jgi:hypothetical protein
MLEIGPKGKKVVPVAPDWPGLERGARTGEAAIERLRSHVPRYATVAGWQGWTRSLRVSAPPWTWSRSIRATDHSRALELQLMPAEIVSAHSRPYRRCLAFLAGAVSSRGRRDAVDLCLFELRDAGGFRDLNEIGFARRMHGAASVAQAPI